MKKVINIIGVTSVFIFGLMGSALGGPEIVIDSETPLKNQQITSGDISVSVTYEPPKPDSSSDTNLEYQIYYQGKKQVDAKDFTMFTGGVSLDDLDNNKVDEVIIKTFSGGAHCCTNFIIYTWDKDKFIKTESGLLDGNGGSFEDLNGDGKKEFITYDNSFLYQFSSYAGSFPPSKIYKLQNGNFIDVTRNYPKFLRESLQSMYKSFLENKKSNYEVNGILAGYVAQKILLGEYESGWKFMLANYDKKSDWGLADYDNNGNVIKKYADFPSALRAFLIRQGYLKK